MTPFGTLQESLESPRLPAVRPQVACVEESTPVRFDQERVSVERAVVDQEGCDLETAELQRLPVNEKARRRQSDAAREEGRLLKDSRRKLSDIDGHLRTDPFDEPVVVGVAMRDHHTGQRLVVSLQQARDLGQRYFLVCVCR